MNRDDIIRLAQEAGLAFDSEEFPEIWQTYMDVGREQIERFAALVTAETSKEIAALKEERRKDMAEICSLRESEESLREEVERLRDELRQSSIDHTRAEVERLREEIDALRADAERYRWHRADIAKHMSHSPEVIDAAIDAAMKRAALQGETAVWAARHDPRE